MPIFIFGHKNPDTDSVASAIAISYLKNHIGEETVPRILGPLNKETTFALNAFQIPKPEVLHDVKAQVSDLDVDQIEGISPNASILSSYKLMMEKKLGTLPIVDNQKRLIGIVSMKDIAMGLIKGDFYGLKTSLTNILRDLKGEILSYSHDEVEGNISVIAYYYKTVKGILSEDDIIIVGDRYDILEYALETKVKLIIVTGGKSVPEKYLKWAKDAGVSMILVPYDTYYTSKMIHQSNYISTIMRNREIIKFHPYDYLEEVKEEMINSNFRNYPLVDDNNIFIGFINRKHVMKAGRKKVILVDHNEYSQSVEGLDEAEILEIIDHHKLGDISTNMPITFRNLPVGSTCTIVCQMFKEYHISVSPSMAGLMIAGILSDTMYFKSPTTTAIDREAVNYLNEIVKIDLDSFAMELFKVGTSLEGQTVEEIFYKDFKEFYLEEAKVGISQVFTMDIDDVFQRKDSFSDFMDTLFQNKSHDLTLLLITDILKEGSYLLFKSSSNIIYHAFHVPQKQGVFIDGLVSRKKQVVPRLLEALRQLR